MKAIKPDELALFGAQQALKSPLDNLPSLERPVKGQGSERVEPVGSRASKGQSPKESKPARKRASTKAEVPSKSDDLASNIAETLKQPGDRSVFIRLTPAEKRELKVVLHHYEMQDVKITETDLGRIAFSALINDFNTNKETSLLARVIYRMNTT